jgi:putative redox protein
MPYLTIKRQRRSTFVANVDGHALVIEDRPSGTGHGAGPTPVELMVAGFAASVAATVDGYLTHHSFLGDGVRVTAHYRLSAVQPHRITSIDLTVNLPPELPPDRRAEIQRAIGQCIVDAAMPQSPEVGVILVSGEVPSTAAS